MAECSSFSTSFMPSPDCLGDWQAVGVEGASPYSQHGGRGTEPQVSPAESCHMALMLRISLEVCLMRLPAELLKV